MDYKTLDLGSGKNPRNPFNASEVFGVDIVETGNPNVKISDLCIDNIPFVDNTFDYVTGFDFLEHIPRVLYYEGVRKQPFIDIMSEVWRVLKPDGIALFHTPAFPHQEAFQDPQHVNIITENTLQYFCRPSIHTNGWSQLELCQQYGFTGVFDAIEHFWSPDIPYHLVWKLRAVK